MGREARKTKRPIHTQKQEKRNNSHKYRTIFITSVNTKAPFCFSEIASRQFSFLQETKIYLFFKRHCCPPCMCLYVPIQRSNKLTNLYEIWYERYVIRVHRKAIILCVNLPCFQYLYHKSQNGRMTDS
jgi:hypothetical protein